MKSAPESGGSALTEADENAFIEFFRKATGNEPFPYQMRIALSKDLPQLVDIPTGAGKTAAVVLAWLWRRRFAAEAVKKATPRRLVYCLPMRVLVEQTRDNAIRWLNNQGLLAGKVTLKKGDGKETVEEYQPNWDTPEKIAVTILMGGEDANKWDIYPERDAIIIGTQDMLLSRALNRGYGMSRYRWPTQFGLLNNDCIWILDEVQLMGEGFLTTVQLQAFRRQIGNLESVQSLWMSATLKPDWLKTVDNEPPVNPEAKISLGPGDKSAETLNLRVAAKKPLSKSDNPIGEHSKIADEIIGAHQHESRTLVVVNTVSRAMELYQSIKKKKPAAALLLIHSRYRPLDRRKIIDKLLADPGKEGTIAVSTQVIEAGVDLTSTTLFSELAPWPSLVQRFGRCNRTGKEQNARVVWFDLPTDEKAQEKLSPPYQLPTLLQAREIILRCTDAGPHALPEVAMAQPGGQVIRKRDLIELFDTTPDITGKDIDISRFIRDNPETEVLVFWRELPETGPEEFEPAPERNELCPVPIKDIRELVTKRDDAWYDDPLGEGGWNRITNASSIYPGMTIMLRSKQGGYDENEGWNPKTKGAVSSLLPSNRTELQKYSDDKLSRNVWQNLVKHSDDVVKAVETITRNIPGLKPWLSRIMISARWHDAGKAHPAFQANIDSSLRKAVPDKILAKAPDQAWLRWSVPNKQLYEENRRRYFRHEMASGLLALQNGQEDLTAYLAAAHHGKVRMSIRSIPEEMRPPEEGRRYARGVWDGDELPAFELGGGVSVPAGRLDLSVMELGETSIGPSWLSRIIALRDDPEIGIFRLAFFEAMLKAADERASGGRI